MSAVEYRVRLAGSEAAFGCAADDTLLRAGQRAGLGFPYECNVGSCGTCRFELVEGDVQVQWADAPGLTENDRKRKRYLGCQTRPLADCTIKLRLGQRYAPPHRPQRLQAVLERSRPLTHDMREFRFVLDAPHSFEPGQYALAYLPGVTGARAYSMSNTPADGKTWEFVVRRTPEGAGTRALFDDLTVGQSIAIDGPYGMAWLRREAPRDILCLAGGSGLAPMLSIARGAMAEPQLAGRKLHFLYGGRTPADVCGHDLLQELPGWGERLSYHPAISPLPGGSSEGWTGDVGYLHEVALERFAARLPEFEIYFAGPTAMAMAVQRMLVDAKVPSEQVHFDQFY
ncbi:MAG: oxidoreductase FAD-binding region [Ramlibacter sp.]|nr:oxidoreductase FAD-binding region [Ramlibacter sp.]